MKTEDCIKYIIDKFGPEIIAECNEAISEEDDEEEIEFHKKIISNVSNPKKWKRLCKYTVGSKVDTEGGKAPYTGQCLGEDEPQLFGGIARVFELADSCSKTYLVVEKNGEIVYDDDFSD